MIDNVLEDKLLLVFVVFCITLISSLVYAQDNNENHLTLLAVSEMGDGNLTGATADLFLEIKPGEGRVFIDTFPLTKLDTQISTRFAKEIACDFLKRNKGVLGYVDCGNYDFIYKIKAKSPIIGGPSAGAAISLLTISSLANLDINEKVAITGTINSGGLIGVVSGIKAKIDAAYESGMKKVLVAYGTNLESDDEKDLRQYAKDKDIELLEVEDLNDVVFYFTGQKIRRTEKELKINEKYSEIMKKLSQELCERSNTLLGKLGVVIDDDLELLKDIDEQLNKSEKSYESGKYYSSASYCFGANVKLNSLFLLQQNMSHQDGLLYAEVLEKKVLSLEKEIDSIEINTISDLQTYMVVKERIIETKELLNDVKNVYNKKYIYDLGFAEERYYSALSWKIFFDSNIGEKNLFEDKKIVKRLCEKKLEEAQERTHYLALIIPIDLDNIHNEIDYAIKDMNNEDYELCLFKSLKAKAQANSILNIINTKEEYINKSLETKLKIVKNNIILENENNIFPLMGYSYYEYADELRYEDIGSALLYAEYALELSNFHLYLDSEIKRVKFSSNKEYEVYIVVFLIGVAVGLLYNFKLVKGKKRRKSRRKTK